MAARGCIRSTPGHHCMSPDERNINTVSTYPDDRAVVDTFEFAKGLRQLRIPLFLISILSRMGMQS
jgi:hypothetical protein